MPTYTDIQDQVRHHHGFAPKTCWIAHVKVLNGLPVRRAWNRAGDGRQEPCPPERRAAIEETFRRLGMM